MFKTELDKESGKYKVYNTRKNEYSKRMFRTKESAENMVKVYNDLANRPRPQRKDLTTEHSRKVLEANAKRHAEKKESGETEGKTEGKTEPFKKKPRRKSKVVPE